MKKFLEGAFIASLLLLGSFCFAPSVHAADISDEAVACSEPDVAAILAREMYDQDATRREKFDVNIMRETSGFCGSKQFLIPEREEDYDVMSRVGSLYGTAFYYLVVAVMVDDVRHYAIIPMKQDPSTKEA